MAGSSHVSTTAARFAKHQKFDRVVMFCGPQDQYQSWQGLQAATEANRFFGFSPVLDGGWSGDQNYRPYGSMGIHYNEFSVGVKNYLSTAGATAPFGGYLVANLHFGSAKSTANDLHWLNYYSSSMLDTLAPVGSEGISSKMTSISYGFGTRNMITEHLGFNFEMTSGLTLKIAAGVKLYNVDNYSSDYNGSTQQEVMTSIMLREIHRSQWVQLKFGLSYLF